MKLRGFWFCSDTDMSSEKPGAKAVKFDGLEGIYFPKTLHASSTIPSLDCNLAAVESYLIENSSALLLVVM